MERRERGRGDSVSKAQRGIRSVMRDVGVIDGSIIFPSNIR